MKLQYIPLYTKIISKLTKLNWRPLFCLSLMLDSERRYFNFSSAANKQIVKLNY